MSRTSKLGEFNNFTAGLITEASPIIFPEKACVDIKNAEILRTGEVRRRKGYSRVQQNAQDNNTSTTASGIYCKETKYNATSFIWDNPKGAEGKRYLVVGYIDKLKFYDLKKDSREFPTLDLIASMNMDRSNLISSRIVLEGGSTSISLASIDGYLIVCRGSQDPVRYYFDNGTLTNRGFPLYIRDFFGTDSIVSRGSFVEGVAVFGSTFNSNLKENWDEKPFLGLETDSALDSENSDGYYGHIYNLRNRGWIPPKSVYRYWDHAQLMPQPTNTGGYPPSYSGAPVNPYPTAERWVGGNALINPSDPIAEYCGYYNSEVMGALRRDETEGINPEQTGVNPQYYPRLPQLGMSIWDHTYPLYEMTRSAEEVFWFTSARKDTREDRSTLGHWVINGVNRGISRRSRMEFLNNKKEEDWETNDRFKVTPDSTEIKTDSHNIGPRVVASAYDRLFYAGFGATAAVPNENSPDLSSYIFYSRVTESFEDFGRCYQKQSPASRMPDVLDDDGGFIKVTGAGSILKIHFFKDRLLIFAEKGIWSLSGGEGSIFTANNHTLHKESDLRLAGYNTITEANGNLFFLTNAGMIVLQRDQFSNLVTKNLTQNTIKSKLDSIDFFYLANSTLIHEKVEDRLRLTGTFVEEGATYLYELIYDISLNCWYYNETDAPIPEGGLVLDVDNVAVSAVATSSLYIPFDDKDEVFYIVSEDRNPLASDTWEDTTRIYERGNSSFRDFPDLALGNIDAEMYIKTGYLSSGDYLRNKNFPAINFYFKRTESSFTEIGEDFVLDNESSCLITPVWDWHEGKISSPKRGKQFQAYKFAELLIADYDDDLANYSTVVQSKHKIAGNGQVLSLEIMSEPSKDLRLLGWSVLLTGENNV